MLRKFGVGLGCRDYVVNEGCHGLVALFRKAKSTPSFERGWEFDNNIVHTGLARTRVSLRQSCFLFICFTLCYINIALYFIGSAKYLNYISIYTETLSLEVHFIVN